MSAQSHNNDYDEPFIIIRNHRKRTSDESNIQQPSNNNFTSPNAPNGLSGKKGKNKNENTNNVKKEKGKKTYSLKSRLKREMGKRKLADEEEERNKIAMWEELLQVEIGYCIQMNYVELLQILAPNGIGQEQEAKEGPFEAEEERQMMDVRVVMEASGVETMEVVPPTISPTPAIPLSTQRQPEGQQYYFPLYYAFQSEEYNRNSNSNHLLYNHRYLGEQPQ